MKKVKIIGGGLAGCEASYQLLKRGVAVELYEMRPEKISPAHKTENLAELVCSNSLKSMIESTASGTLKMELETFDCLLLKCAKKSAVPAGSALAVDREIFSKEVEKELNKFVNFKLIRQEIINIDINMPTIIASGPLTSDNLGKEISKLFNSDYLHFYDAVSPIVNADSIDYDIAFYSARYNNQDTDYLNLGMNDEQYQKFYHELINAKCVELKNFEKREIFEGCMPIEVMAKRGSDSIRFGPLKPIGITNPKNGEKYRAVVQLRRENLQNNMFNLVGFQTNLTWGEQKRVFSLIPGLENAEFLRYGVMHRNTYLNAPKTLKSTFQAKDYDNLFFAGQITGVEGYVESIMSGLFAGINMYNFLNNQKQLIAPDTTITGALMQHISFETENYQPMNANFGILPKLENQIKDKKLRKIHYYNRAKSDIILFKNSLEEVIND